MPAAAGVATSDTPALLYECPRTIFEAFMNAYYVSDYPDYVAAGLDGNEKDQRAIRCQAAWKRFRRVYPDILITRDETKIQDWVQEVKGGCPVPVALTQTAAAAPAPAGADTNGTADTEVSGEGNRGECTRNDDGGDAADADEGRGAGCAGNGAAVGDDGNDDGGSADGEDADDEEVDPARPSTRDEDELGAGVDAWGADDVEEFIMSLTRLKETRANHVPRLKAIAQTARTQSIDGKLLLAGGAGLLVERTSGYVKWPTSILKTEANFIVERLRARVAETAVASYADRNPRLQRLYKESPEWLAAAVADALVPRAGAALEEIRYCVLCTRHAGERACALDGVDEDVSKRVGRGNTAQTYKVVSVVTPDDVREVHHNVVYVRKDGRWSILVSVDFMQHGSALPGHWHLNRAPLGEFVPHWGPANDVFHGAPEACPVWWQLIPRGYRYRMAPDRKGMRGGNAHQEHA